MRVVALGDSFTCGEGVGVRVPADRTWTALLAERLHADHTSYAAPGARLRDVLHDQLPQVQDAQVATLLVGLNDVVRGAFDPARFTDDLTELVASLRTRAPVVLLGRLHDPTRILRIPYPLGDLVRRRVDLVNEAIDLQSGVWVLDLDVLPAWRRRGAWDLDRVHPSSHGHAALAQAAGSLLGLHVERQVDVPRGRSLAGQAFWFGRHGAPYLASHVRELACPVWESLPKTRASSR